VQADISGPQRKILGSRVTPLRAEQGDSGIPVRAGVTLPFRVIRSWSAPAGVYLERFYLIDPTTREVLFEGPERVEAIRGLQAITELEDVVTEAFKLSPGTYALVFALGGISGGEIPVEAIEVSSEAAA